MTDREALKKLVIRSLAGTATSIAGLVAIKAFSLTLYATAQNISPVVTVVLGYFMINDKIKCEDVLLLFIVLGGVFVTKLCAFFPDLDHCPTPAKDKVMEGPSAFDYILLAYIPIGIAFTNILLRKMKGLHFIQLSVYKIIIALSVAAIICIIEQSPLNPVLKFKWYDWVILVVGSLIQQASVIARKISFNHAPPSKLAHYAYVNTIYSFGFDSLIPFLMAKFNLYSYIGYGVIIAGFIMKFISIGKSI